MIATILLVFSMNDLPFQTSQRIFTTLDECADFVDMIAGKPVIDSEYKFDFISIEPSDGSLHTFKGQCEVQQKLEAS